VDGAPLSQFQKLLGNQQSAVDRSWATHRTFPMTVAGCQTVVGWGTHTRTPTSLQRGKGGGGERVNPIQFPGGLSGSMPPRPRILPDIGSHWMPLITTCRNEDTDPTHVAGDWGSECITPDLLSHMAWFQLRCEFTVSDGRSN
jgi:hypothetical protein